MSQNTSSVQEVVLDGRTAKDLLRRGQIRQISLQTKEGLTLVGAPVQADLARVVPGVFRAPARAVACASALVARLAGLRIVVERDD